MKLKKHNQVKTPPIPYFVLADRLAQWQIFPMGVRFAPSPTGTFHIGNLRTAWISYRIAKIFELPWTVRFEDIDHPRVLPGSQSDQTKDLLRLGLHPDKILVQSHYHERHWELFTKAVAANLIYPCHCSRKEVQESIAGMQSAPHGPQVLYDGTCRDNSSTESSKIASALAKCNPLSVTNPATSSSPFPKSIAWRFKNSNSSGKFDFVIGRSVTTNSLDSSASPQNFTPAYHWACAIDDYDFKYRILVRASDLASAFPIQKTIYKMIGQLEGNPQDFPSVYHTALITSNDGSRLEKRTKGVKLEEVLGPNFTVKDLLLLFEKSWKPIGELPVPASELDEYPRTLSLEALGIHV